MLGKVGYAARAIVFVVLGGLVVLTGVGLKSSQDDPIGALEQIARAPFGQVLIGVVGVGLAAYVAWNVVLGSAMGISALRHDRKKRVVVGVGYVLTGAFYAPLAWASAKLAFGHRAEGRSRDLGALFDAPYGRTIVFVIGVALLVAAVVQLVIGLGRTFTEPLDMGSMSARRRHAIVALGVFGFLARAALFGVVGGLLTRAAVLAAPSQARGSDQAIDFVVTLPHGVLFLLPLGVGLAAFGVFSMLALPRLEA